MMEYNDPRHRGWQGRRVGRGVATVLLTVVVLSLQISVVWAGPPAFQRAESALGAWQMTEARKAIDDFSQATSSTAYLEYLEGRYAFYSGDYPKALELLDEAIAAEPRGDWKRLRDIVAETVEVTADYQGYMSPSGRFEVFVEPGRDELLLPYAFEALDEAYDVLGDEIGHRPDQPVRVEIYPRETVLARVSMLTEDNIRTSGTIALCQYNRLMITSPRAVLRGYTWVDTLIHEYVHLIINQRTTETVPIWMHEGLAKFLERRWRSADAAKLDASAEHLLQQRLEEDNLIPFEAMHPSMALLPSQQDAAVAFAQVYTTMEYLRREVGQGAFAKLLDTVDQGYEARQAYARVLGTTWEEFENRIWPAYLTQRSTPDLPDDEDEIYEEKLVFDDQAAEMGNELSDVDVPEAREHMQLGQMLQVRKRYGAAAVQYQKAAEILGDRNPVLQTRTAKVLTLSGSAEEAVEALQTVKELYPGYVSTWVELGRAHLANEEYRKARSTLREAARINPFNPEIHELLARAHRHLGDQQEAEDARKAAALARGR